jgi:hypothetical protein
MYVILMLFEILEKCIRLFYNIIISYIFITKKKFVQKMYF